MNQNEFTLQLALRLLTDPQWRGFAYPDDTEGLASKGAAAYRDAEVIARGVFAEAEKFE